MSSGLFPIRPFSSSGGDVVGPASSVNGALALFDGVTGKLLQVGIVPAALGFSLIQAATVPEMAEVLGLTGLMAYQTPDDVAITGGTIQGITEATINGATINGVSVNSAAALADSVVARLDIPNTFTDVCLFQGNARVDGQLQFNDSSTYIFNFNGLALNAVQGGDIITLYGDSGIKIRVAARDPAVDILADGTMQHHWLDRKKSFLVVNLPAAVQGDEAFVTDALAPTWGAAVVGGGFVACPVHYDGGNWIAG